VIKAGVGQFQAQGVFPVDAAADGVGGLAIGQALDVLKDRGQCEVSASWAGEAAGCPRVGKRSANWS
jgi:hypothetical protein